MFKIIWGAVKEQTRLIGQNPAAAYGAVMTGITIFLFYICIRLGSVVYQQMNARVTDKNESARITIELGRTALDAQQMSREAMAEARSSRDSAFMWKMLYQEQSRNRK